MFALLVVLAASHTVFHCFFLLNDWQGVPLSLKEKLVEALETPSSFGGVVSKGTFIFQAHGLVSYFLGGRV